MQQVSIPCCRPGELGATVWAARLGGLARLLSLVAEEVAEGRELAAIAPMLPTLGLGPALNNADVPLVVVLVGGAAGLHHRRNRVHHCWIVGDGSINLISFKPHDASRDCGYWLTHNARREEHQLMEGKSSPYIVAAGMGWGNPFGWKMAVVESRRAGPFAVPGWWAR